MSPQLSRDKKIPGLEFPKNPGSKRLKRSRDFGIPKLAYIYAYFTNSSKKEQRIRQRRSTFLGKMTGSAAGRESFIIAILFPEIYHFICQRNNQGQGTEL